jgi:nitroreductase
VGLKITILLKKNMKYNLSEILDVIKNRRTIYPENYSSRVVQKDIIEKLLNSAIWAPTHGKTQPWRFHVFMEGGRTTLSNKLGSIYADLYKKDTYNELKHKKLMNRPLLSSAIIAVSMSRDPSGKIPEIEEVEAVACAMQNMLLSATAYGLGTFWSSPKIIYTKEMNAFLELEENDQCLGLLYIGYPSEEWPSGQRKPIEYVTKWINQ